MRLRIVSVGEFGKLSYLGSMLRYGTEYLHHFIFVFEYDSWMDYKGWFEEFDAVAHCYHPEEGGAIRMVISTCTQEDIRRPERYMRSVAGKLIQCIKRNYSETADRARMEWAMEK